MELSEDVRANGPSQWSEELGLLPRGQVLTVLKLLCCPDKHCRVTTEETGYEVICLSLFYSAHVNLLFEMPRKEGWERDKVGSKSKRGKGGKRRMCSIHSPRSLKIFLPLLCKPT